MHLDLEALGLTPGKPFMVEDLVDGERWEWSTSNYVRLDAFTRPAHVLRVVREPVRPARASRKRGASA